MAKKKDTAVEGAAPAAKKDPKSESLYRKYRVTIQIRDKILGGWPKNLDAELAMMVTEWMRTVCP